MTDNLYSTVDYTNWLNATSGYEYDNYTLNYDDESYFTSYQNVSPTANNNGTYDPNEFVLPVWRQILWSILFGGMVIVSTVGNLIVIWIVLAHKRMRTPTNYFLVNLSIADAMVSTLNVTFSFTYMLNSHWPFGTLYCKISQFVAILSIGASVFTLMAIAIDRVESRIGPHLWYYPYAESTNKAITLNDTKEMKLEVTDNDGRVFVKEIRGEEMACVMKCFPVKTCRTKATPEEEIVVHTTPIPTEIDDATDTTEAKMTTIAFRSATSLSKKEQAVSAETTTEMSHSAKEENQKSEDDRELNSLTTSPPPTTTVNQNLATGIAANDRPKSSLTFETIYDVKAVPTTTTKQHDPYSDYNTLSSGSKLDTLDLVTSLEPFTTTPTPTKFPTLHRRHEAKPTENVPLTLLPPSTFIPSADIELKDQNLRRHSHEEHEDYDIECDSTEADLKLTEPADTFEDKLNIQPTVLSTEKPIVTPSVEKTTLFESMRRMSESEEISTECDSAEELEETLKSSTIAGSFNEPFSTINLATGEVSTTERTTITDSMRRMSESNEMQTECDSVEVNERVYQTVTDQSVTKTTSTSPPVHSTQTEEATTTSPSNDLFTTFKPKKLPENELSRRMSESDVECYHNNELQDSILMTPISESMRRMSDSNENSSGGCDWHDDFVEVTTAAPSASGSMRRMSSLDQPTTEQNFEEQTEFVTECDTVVPETSNDVHNPVGMKKNVTLECCPDMVCSLLYPSTPICDKQRAANYIRKLVELRDKFYFNRAHVLITELVGENSVEYYRMRTDYEREIVSLWNDTLSIPPNGITNGCTNISSSNNVKKMIPRIYCVLKYTDSLLLTDSVLEMVVDAAERIETDFANTNAKNYPRFRQIILQSISKVPHQSDSVSALANYMLHNRNYENERLLLLQLLIDVQQRFEPKADKYIASQMNIKITDASKSLQENGVGVNLHRNLN